MKTAISKLKQVKLTPMNIEVMHSVKYATAKKTRCVKNEHPQSTRRRRVKPICCNLLSYIRIRRFSREEGLKKVR